MHRDLWRKRKTCLHNYLHSWLCLQTKNSSSGEKGELKSWLRSSLQNELDSEARSPTAYGLPKLGIAAKARK
jgi:hypothetical protein